MAGLFTSLSMAARSLEAQRAGLDVAGQNIANLNTPGYTRRRLDLAEIVDGTGGVEVLGTRALRDRVLDARARTAIPDESREGAIAQALSLVETGLGAPGSGIDGRLSAFFDSLASLTADPTSPVARNGVLLQGRQLANAFNTVAAQFADSRRLADAGVREATGQINTLSAHIADLNTAISSAQGVDVEALQDQQQVALEELSALTAVAVMQRKDGGVDVTIPSGRSLVIGSSAYRVSVGTDVNGFATMSLGNTDVTGDFTTGRIGGLVHARDTVIPGYQTQLDQLAHTVAQQVNTAHQAGFDQTGAAGLAFFTPPAAVAGAAASLTMNAAVAADPQRVAASQTGAPGDNGAARAMAALREARVLNGGTATFTQGWAQLTYSVGTDVSTAIAQQQSQQDLAAQIARLRDQASGVSLDEEAASMLKFQRAYEANAKYFTTVDSLLQTLMNTVGVI